MSAYVGGSGAVSSCPAVRGERPFGVTTTEHRLSDVLSEFASTMLTDFPIQGILDQLVRRIVEVMPITGAGVTLISDTTSPHYATASDSAALQYEKLQTELNEGPCIVSYRSGEAVAIADLRQDRRFPLFTPRAVAAGLSAVFTFPLRQGDKRLGALDLYRNTPGALSRRGHDRGADVGRRGLRLSPQCASSDRPG